jgi:hypothetical protein
MHNSSYFLYCVLCVIFVNICTSSRTPHEPGALLGVVTIPPELSIDVQIHNRTSSVVLNKPGSPNSKLLQSAAIICFHI